MRNLKRALSLALASVMLLGMMVIGASAVSISDFTDQDEIVNKEAVALLVDLGIVNGKSDTNFGATDTLERTALAKMVYIALTGTDDASMYADMNVFSDVTAANCWAAGYINYCYSVGILSGVGGDRFSPYSSLTVAQTAKALLVALGYVPDADISMYEGNDWAINVMRDAQANRLLDGIGQSAHQAITRDNAARMIFNALFANMVTPKYQYDMGTRYVTEYETVMESVSDPLTLGEYTFNLKKITATVDAINADGTAAVTVTPSNATEEALIDNKFSVTPDMVGSNVVAYYNRNTNTLYSTALTAGDSTVLSTTTDGTKVAALTTVGNRNYVASLESGAKYFLNGATSNATSVDAAIVRGSVVELVDNNANGQVDVVRVTNKTVATLAAAPVVNTTTSGTTVTVSSVPGLARIDADKVHGYEGLAKDDVVLWVKLGDNFYLEKAASVTGVVSGLHSTNGIQVNGTYYKNSGLSGAANSWSNDFSNTYTFYLDNGNNIVKAVADTSATNANYAVVTDVAWVAGSGIGSSNYVEAQLLFADGTTEIVRIASVDGFVPVAAGSALANGLYYNNSGSAATTSSNNAAAGTFYYTNNSTDVVPAYFGVSTTANLTSAAGKTLTNTTTVGSDAAFIAEGRFYSYTINAAGNYVLSSTANGTDTFGAVNSSITNGSAAVGSSIVGNSATVFLYAVTNSDNTVTYTVYTGIANAPTASGVATTAGSVVVNANNFATLVYVDAATVDGTFSKDLVYITSNAYTTRVANGVTYYTQNAIVNGVATTVDLTAHQTVGMYEVSGSTTSGYLTLTSSLSGNVKEQVGVWGNSGSVLVAGDGDGSSTAYAYDSAVLAYYIASDGTSTQRTPDSIALDATDELYIVMSSTSAGAVVETIYVVEKDAEPETLVVSGTSSVADGTSDTSNSTKDLVVGAVKTTGTAGQTVVVTPTRDDATGTDKVNYRITITGAGTEVTSASDNAAATYTLVAADANTDLRVSVVATDVYSKAISVYEYTIAVGAVTGA